MNGVCSTGLFLGRLFLSAIFIFAGVGKFLDMEGTVQYVSSLNIPYPPVAAVAAALVELIGGLMLLFGLKTRFAALMLMAFLVVVTFAAHSFWHLTGAEQKVQMINFLKNAAIFGGLFYVLSVGSGKCACDYFCCKDQHKI